MTEYRISVNRRDIGGYDKWIEAYQAAADMTLKDKDVLVISSKRNGIVAAIIDGNVLYLTPDAFWGKIKKNIRAKLAKIIDDFKVTFTDDPIALWGESGNPFIATSILEAIEYQDTQRVLDIYARILQALGEITTVSPSMQYYMRRYNRDIQAMSVLPITVLLLELQQFIMFILTDELLTMEEIHGIIVDVIGNLDTLILE